MIQTSEYLVNKGQIAKIHVLLAQIPGLGDKAERNAYKCQLVREFTNGRAESTTQLTWKEAKDMIAALERIVSAPVAVKQTKPKEAASKKYVNPSEDIRRKKIIHYAHLMGWYEGVNNMSVNKQPGITGDGASPPRRKINMAQIDGWCMTYGKFKKPLNEHNSAELSILITQMERVYEDYLNAV